MCQDQGKQVKIAMLSTAKLWISLLVCHRFLKTSPLEGLDLTRLHIDVYHRVRQLEHDIVYFRLARSDIKLFCPRGEVDMDSIHYWALAACMGPLAPSSMAFKIDRFLVLEPLLEHTMETIHTHREELRAGEQPKI